MLNQELSCQLAAQVAILILLKMKKKLNLHNLYRKKNKKHLTKIKMKTENKKDKLI